MFFLGRSILDRRRKLVGDLFLDIACLSWTGRGLADFLLARGFDLLNLAYCCWSAAWFCAALPPAFRLDF